MSRRCQQDDCWTKQHSSLSEKRISCRWNGEDRADAPDQSSRVYRRQKQFFRHVANSIRVAVGYWVRLTDHGHDGARDQVPVFVDVQRNDRLNVENLLRAIEWPRVEIG